jgi:hypothetical protein
MKTIRVTQEQFERIEDAWYLASEPGGRKAVGDKSKWFDWAVEHVTGIDVRGLTYAFDVAKG